MTLVIEAAPKCTRFKDVFWIMATWFVSFWRIPYFWFIPYLFFFFFLAKPKRIVAQLGQGCPNCTL